MVRFRDTKAYRLADLMGGDPEFWTDEERAIINVTEMNMDVSLAMATGTVSTWIQLARLYDSEKSLSNQSMEFQRQAAVTAASSIGMGFVLHAAGINSFEFAVGRSVALKPITKVAYHPLVAGPAAMVAATRTYPSVAGPQYQSAMSGQPNIGSAGGGLIGGSITWKDIKREWKGAWSGLFD